MNCQGCFPLSLSFSLSPSLWYIYIYIYIYMLILTLAPPIPLKTQTHVYFYLPTPPDNQNVTQGQFYAEFNRFEFEVFLPLHRLPYQGWTAQSAPLFTHSWGEKNWIHNFPKGISVMWNANSLVQDLNSCRCVHFLQRWLSHCEHHLIYVYIGEHLLRSLGDLSCKMLCPRIIISRIWINGFKVLRN